MPETVTRGTNWGITGYWHVDGVRRDITGATMRFVCKARERDEVPVLEKDNDTLGGITFTDAAQGEYEISVDTDDLDDMDPRYSTLYCSLWLEEASGDISNTEIRLNVNSAP